MKLHARVLLEVKRDRWYWRHSCPRSCKKSGQPILGSQLEPGVPGIARHLPLPVSGAVKRARRRGPMADARTTGRARAVEHARQRRRPGAARPTCTRETTKALRV